MTSSRMMMIVVVEITTVEAPPTSLVVHLLRRVRRLLELGAGHRVDRGDGARDVKAELRRNRLNFRPLERFSHVAAIRVLFRCGHRDRRRELAGRDDVLLACKADDEPIINAMSGTTKSVRTDGIGILHKSNTRLSR
jgi:hypothetical protein